MGTGAAPRAGRWRATVPGMVTKEVIVVVVARGREWWEG
jgi:hypothetical protein